MIAFMRSYPGIVIDFLPKGAWMINTPLPEVIVRSCWDTMLLCDVLLESMKLGFLWMRMSPELDSFVVMHPIHPILSHCE
jgi:hypothetical protein